MHIFVFKGSFKGILPTRYFPKEVEIFLVSFSDNTKACKMCPTCFPDVSDLKEHIKAKNVCQKTQKSLISPYLSNWKTKKIPPLAWPGVFNWPK